MLNVVCIKAGTKYSAEYVGRLQRGVSRFLSIPHRFICLTDDSAGLNCESLPLDEPLTGWWHKVTLFKANPYGMNGRLLFLDLDVVVTGPLDAIAEWPSNFGIIRDYVKPQTYNSSVLVLDVGTAAKVWDNFNDKARACCRGDQDWITSQLPNERTFPAEWCPSYKHGIGLGFDSCRLVQPPAAKVVVFHGKPKPHECDGWVREAWAA